MQKQGNIHRMVDIVVALVVVVDVCKINLVRSKGAIIVFAIIEAVPPHPSFRTTCDMSRVLFSCCISINYGAICQLL